MSTDRRLRFRRAVRRAKIEALVDYQRQEKACAACSAICPDRVPFSIDAIVDDAPDWICGEDLGPRPAQMLH